MIRAAILSLAVFIAGVGSVSAGECGKLCDPNWWVTATQREVAAEITTVDVNARAENGSTPLHWAASYGSPINVTILLKAGANVNARTKTGETPLHTAALWGTAAHIKVLLKAGADVNARQSESGTPLHYAGISDNPDKVLALLDAGADGRAKDKYGSTPFDYTKDNEKLKDTDAYWALHDAQYD